MCSVVSPFSTDHTCTSVGVAGSFQPSAHFTVSISKYHNNNNGAFGSRSRNLPSASTQRWRRNGGAPSPSSFCATVVHALLLLLLMGTAACVGFGGSFSSSGKFFCAAAPTSITNHQCDVADSNGQQCATIDSFTLTGANGVIEIKNINSASSGTSFTTRVTNGVIGDPNGPASHQQRITLQADPIANPPAFVGRAPWTIEVADISFATPNGRVEFRGRFPDGSQISVQRLTYTGQQQTLPLGSDAAFVFVSAQLRASAPCLSDATAGVTSPRRSSTLRTSPWPRDHASLLAQEEGGQPSVLSMPPASETLAG